LKSDGLTGDLGVYKKRFFPIITHKQAIALSSSTMTDSKTATKNVQFERLIALHECQKACRDFASTLKRCGPDELNIFTDFYFYSLEDESLDSAEKLAKDIGDLLDESKLAGEVPDKHFLNNMELNCKRLGKEYRPLVKIVKTDEIPNGGDKPFLVVKDNISGEVHTCFRVKE